MVIYNAKANCSLLHYDFNDFTVKSEKIRKHSIRFLPKSENNKNFASEEQFMTIDFELDARTYHYSYNNLILREVILLNVKFDIDSEAESENKLDNLVSAISAQSIKQYNEDKNFKIIVLWFLCILVSNML